MTEQQLTRCREKLNAHWAKVIKTEAATKERKQKLVKKITKLFNNK
ncbi:hypothetical protein [Glaesserella sp.]